MDPLRLTREELEYELRVRGYADVTSVSIAAMRKAVSQDLKTEQLGELKSLGGDIDVNAELKVDCRIARIKAESQEVLTYYARAYKHWKRQYYTESRHRLRRTTPYYRPYGPNRYTAILE
ncbi:hypothetical protein CBL_10771 [Carabus blaptoides fortunei]